MGDLRQFGDLVREARLRHGLSAYELAARIKRQPSFLSRLENGQNANPPEPAVLKALTNVLGLSRKQMLISMGYLDESDIAPSSGFNVDDYFEPADSRRALISFVMALDPDEDDDVIEVLEGLVQFALGRQESANMGRKR